MTLPEVLDSEARWRFPTETTLPPSRQWRHYWTLGQIIRVAFVGGLVIAAIVGLVLAATHAAPTGGGG